MTAKNASAKKSAKPAAAKKAPAKKVAAAKPADRSAAIAASWQDKKVRAARISRTAVKVGGTEYRSVGEAFRELGLPLGQCIRFRMELKASESGRLTFTDEKGKKFNFIALASE